MIQEILKDTLQEIQLDIIDARTYIEGKTYTKPHVLIVNSNPDDMASQSYIKNKVKVMKENGCEVDVKLFESAEEAHQYIYHMGHMYTSIICQLPLRKEDSHWEDKIMDLIAPEQDIDRLTNYYSEPTEMQHLPATAEGIMRMIYKVQEAWDLPVLRVWLRGNGKCVNKRLFRYLINQPGFDVRLTNSKTSQEENDRNSKWCDLCVTATGQPESLYLFDKIVIDATIFIREDGVWVGDLASGCKEYNDCHGVLGNVGLLTTHMITLKALEDV